VAKSHYSNGGLDKSFQFRFLRWETLKVLVHVSQGRALRAFVIVYILLLKYNK
jgi:hypothetical protein